MDSPRLIAKVSLETDVGTALSATRIRLLEEIDRLGSINRAAKAVPLSYKAAWEAVDIMNNLASEPLVLRVTGGRQGGGTQLTAYGRRMIAMYRALEIEYQTALDQLAMRMGEAGGTDDVAAFRTLLHRMRLSTSARNQFSGVVTGLIDGGVGFEVRLAIDDHLEIVAVITKTSAENLALRIGSEALALVKSSSVMLATDSGILLSARNQLWGEVLAVHEGASNNEVTLELPSGRTLTSVVTATSCRTLGIAPGARACAIFKSSSVILAACN